MLKQFCPHCLKSVEIPESAAGSDAPCPECGKSFPIPARYSPTVSATPAPVLPPPPPPEPVILPPAPSIPSSSPTLPDGYTRSRGFTISPCVVSWIPAVSLTVILLLTMVPWVGVYPGGYPVYTQGAWRAITGRPTQNIQLEDLLMKDLPPPSVYDRTTSDWFIMLPYVLALLMAVVLAWAGRIEIPAIENRIPSLWPYRNAILAGLAVSALVLISVQSARGFGLERAMHAAVSEKFNAQRERAGESPGEQKKIEFYEARELTNYGLERSCWFCVVMCLHVLVPLAMIAQLALNRRGNKPLPRIVLQY